VREAEDMDESKRIKRLTIYYLLAMVLPSLALPAWTSNRPMATSEWLLYAFVCEVCFCLFGGAVFLILGIIISLFSGNSGGSRVLIGLGARLGTLAFLTRLITSAFHTDDNT
jgi:hypothetical protein